MPTNTTHILVVEDSLTQARQIAYLLEKYGYAVTTAPDGQTALDIICVSPPSLIITDIIMPGMSGYELCARIRRSEATSSLPVILLTSLNSAQDIILALECGADDFISKPFNADYLITRLAIFLDRLRQKQDLPLEKVGEEVFHAGKWYHISAGRQKMLDLLISTYEATIQKNHELSETQASLKDANLKLEIAVGEKQEAFDAVQRKDRSLESLNQELQVMNRLGQAINQSGNLPDLYAGVWSELKESALLGTLLGNVVWMPSKDGTIGLYWGAPASDQLSEEIMSLDPTAMDQLFPPGQEELIVTSVCGQDALCPWIAHGPTVPHGHILMSLQAREHRIGAFSMITKPGTKPTDRVLKMLRSLGEQIGLAVENHRLFSETKRLSLHDALTGLANRRMIEVTLESQIARANRHHSNFVILLLDIDHFKHYNDNYGHDAGDRILFQLGKCLKERTRNTDLAARYGGEEFLIILSDSSMEDAVLLADSHRETIQSAVGVTVSIGIAEYKAEQSREALFKAADDALYLAKKNGRNRVERAK